MSQAQVSPGYKRTEVGEIPIDWEVRRLGEVAHIKTGDRNNQDKIEDGTYPFFIRSQTIERINTYSFDGEAILVPGEGGIGNIIHYINGRFDYHQRVYKISDFDERISGKYTYYTMLYSFHAQATRYSVKATVDSLRLPTFQNYTFLVPPLPEQRAIAEVLSDVDALLDALDRLIVKKRAIKQGAMQALLTGRVRLPGFERTPGYKRTEVGEIPADWEVEEINKITDVRTGPFGSVLHESDYVEDGIPIITVEHLNGHGITNSNLPMVSLADKRRLKTYELQENDIVFSRVGSIDRNALVKSSEAGWFFSGRLLRVRPNPSNVFAPYLSHHFHTEQFKTRVRGVAVGQTMPSLNTKILNEIVIILPPLPEQRAIAEVLTDMDSEIDALEQRRAKLQAIKQGMMQELLTGRTRLV